jgi:hypothetical protein
VLSFSATTTTVLTWVTAESAAHSNARTQLLMSAARGRRCSQCPGQESGPVESLTVRNRLNVFHLTLSTRATLPSCFLRGYKGRGFSYAHGDIPIEVEDVELTELLPGKAAEVEFSFSHLMCGTAFVSR